MVPLATFLLMVGGAELYLRSCSPVHFGEPLASVGPWPLIHRRSSVPGLTYELEPGAYAEVGSLAVRTNSLGMRDREPLAEDTPGLCRIAVLGDSIAFGLGVAQEDAFCDQLERALETAPGIARRCDVLNFAVSGYSTQDEVDLFVHRVLPLRPDLVVVAYCLNDPASGEDQALPRYFKSESFWQRSHLARLVARRIHRARVRSLGGGNYYRFLHSPEGPEWPTVVNAFERLRRETERMEIPVLVVIFPWALHERWEDYPYAALHDQVARTAEEHGFQALDLLPAFQAHAPFEVEFSAQDPHPTALGHAVAAREAARVVGALLGELAPRASSPLPIDVPAEAPVDAPGTDGDR